MAASGPFHRKLEHFQRADSGELPSQLRVLSPRGSLPGINNAYNNSRGRRRGPSFGLRLCQGATVALLLVCIVASFVRFSQHVKRLEHEEWREHVPIDVVGVSLKPSCVTRTAIQQLNLYLRPRTIHVITTNEEKCAIYRSFAPNIVCHLQDEVLEGLTVDAVGRYLKQDLGLDQHKQFKGRELEGWYMQQFLKLATAQALPELSQYYLVWDLDMLLLSPIQLLWHVPDPAPATAGASATGASHSAGASGGVEGLPSGGYIQTLVNIGGSVSRGYITAFRRLMHRQLEFAPDGSSFVTHWMVVYKPYLLEFLAELSVDPPPTPPARGQAAAAVNVAPPPGTPAKPLAWVWRILSAVDPGSADLGFSEYASYISWVRQRYPHSQRMATKKTWVRHPFGQRTIKLLRLLRADQCCCPPSWLLRLLKSMGFVYTGYEVGHIDECRYSDPEYVTSYGLDVGGKAG
ncbi:hypothetical protein HYH03_011972 [Edaphochlamys debaryana]|uniref:Uncharacterized protein n=1 Tax=Edaphochlamys debaryana TaxID=47281 RepID=A0A836BUF7_9CHLO|nr:hypothetical protein HYH03_011972 [Edaphochlamys debaryana]|eukprot:KAG2489521.1 hypothetical protein HYH03_011972 [Edaphochlamys debaryana]